jgi:hypothetical protein
VLLEAFPLTASVYWTYSFHRRAVFLFGAGVIVERRVGWMFVAFGGGGSG